MSKNKPRYSKSKRNTNKLVRVKTGPSVKDRIVNTISKIKDNKSSKNTPTQGSPDSKILNESTSVSRYKDMIAQDINSAYLAGGSRPMTQGNTIQSGVTNAPNMGNFGGAMSMSNVPNNPIDPMTGLPMNQAMMAQENKMKLERRPIRKGPDLIDSTAAFMGGPHWNNPHWKASSDSVRAHYPNINFDEVKSKDIYKPSKGEHLGTITSRLKPANKRYNINPLPQEVKGFKANVKKIMNEQGKSKEEATKILAAATWKHNPEKMAQDRTGEYYDKTTTDYTNTPSEKIPVYERNRKINKINLMAGRGPNLDSIQKVNSEATSGALKEYYKGTKWKKDISKSTKEFNKLSKEERHKL